MGTQLPLSSTQNSMSIFAKLCLLAVAVAAADGAKCKVEGWCRKESRKVDEVVDDAPDVEMCHVIAQFEIVDHCGNKKDEPVTVTYTDNNGKSSTFKVGPFDPNDFITGK